jgi:hypothetical protein
MLYFVKFCLVKEVSKVSGVAEVPIVSGVAGVAKV